MTKKLTDKCLRNVKERADAASIGWVATDETYVVTLGDEGETQIVAECQSENDAYFISEARQDVPALLEEIESLRKLVFGIGRVVERQEILSDDSDELYEELMSYESECVKRLEYERASKGLLICEGCLDEYAPDTSISKYFCGPCVDRNDMERLGWDIHGTDYEMEESQWKR